MTPFWVRLLFPCRKRGRLIGLEIQRLTQLIADYLTRISLIYLSVYELASSTHYIEWIIKKRPSLHHIKRAIRAICIFLVQLATYEGRIARDLRRRTYAAAYAAIFNFDNKPKVHQIHFDQGFSILFDNGANVSIGIHEDDFIELKKKRGSISGVGSAKAEGIGTIHWKLHTDSGKYIDVFIRDALYVPSMDLRIISVVQWGKQRTEDHSVVLIQIEPTR